MGPLLYFLYCAYDVFLWEHVSWKEQAVQIIFLISNCLSFLSSTLFHWFGCCNERAQLNLVRFDISMIALLIGGNTHNMILFTCFQAPIFLLCIMRFIVTKPFVHFIWLPFLCARLLVLSWPCFLHFPVMTIVCCECLYLQQLQVCFICFFFWNLQQGFGLCPIFHIVSLYGVTDEVAEFLVFLFTVYLLCGAGLLLYASRIPERYFPNKFDIYVCTPRIIHSYYTSFIRINFGICSVLYLNVLY